MILDNINSPKDLKKCSVSELETVANEIREGLFNRLTKIGGHFGPNFGFVEATIALHYVFDSPNDKFVFDVKCSQVERPATLTTAAFQKILAIQIQMKVNTIFLTSGTLLLQLHWL